MPPASVLYAPPEYVTRFATSLPQFCVRAHGLWEPPHPDTTLAAFVHRASAPIRDSHPVAVVHKVTDPQSAKSFFPECFVKLELPECTLTDAHAADFCRTCFPLFTSSCCALFVLGESTDNAALQKLIKTLLCWSSTIQSSTLDAPLNPGARSAIAHLETTLSLTVSQRHQLNRAARDAAVRGHDVSLILSPFTGITATDKRAAKRHFGSILDVLTAP